jgi:hypothetical protein
MTLLSVTLSAQINDSVATIQVLNKQDTLFLESKKVNALIEKLENENTNGKYLQLAAVFLGTLLTLIGQSFFKYFDNNTIMRKEKAALKGRLISNSNLLKFYLSELAYLEIDSIYQFYLCQGNVGTLEKQKALDEHYNDYKYISDYRNKIADSISGINADYICYYDSAKSILPKSDWSIIQIVTLQLANLEKPGSYGDEMSITDSMVKGDVARLCSKYVTIIQPIEPIIQNLK